MLNNAHIIYKMIQKKMNWMIWKTTIYTTNAILKLPKNKRDSEPIRAILTTFYYRRRAILFIWFNYAYNRRRGKLKTSIWWNMVNGLRCRICRCWDNCTRRFWIYWTNVWNWIWNRWSYINYSKSIGAEYPYQGALGLYGTKLSRI